jgi:hypothetical protein
VFFCSFAVPKPVVFRAPPLDEVDAEADEDHDCIVGKHIIDLTQSTPKDSEQPIDLAASPRRFPSTPLLAPTRHTVESETTTTTRCPLLYGDGVGLMGMDCVWQSPQPTQPPPGAPRNMHQDDAAHPPSSEQSIHLSDDDDDDDHHNYSYSTDEMEEMCSDEGEESIEADSESDSDLAELEGELDCRSELDIDIDEDLSDSSDEIDGRSPDQPVDLMQSR